VQLLTLQKRDYSLSSPCGFWNAPCHPLAGLGSAHKQLEPSRWQELKTSGSWCCVYVLRVACVRGLSLQLPKVGFGFWLYYCKVITTTQFLTPPSLRFTFKLYALCEEAQDEGHTFELKTPTQMVQIQFQIHPAGSFSYHSHSWWSAWAASDACPRRSRRNRHHSFRQICEHSMVYTT
jgi:hypothetical protein